MMLGPRSVYALARHVSRMTSRLPSPNITRVRTFVSTRRVQEEGPNKVHESSLFRQLATNPEAQAAMRDFYTLLEKQGINLKEKAPSKMQIFGLLAIPEFRQGVQKLKDDLEKAGVEITPENAMAMLNAFKDPAGKE